MAESSPSAVRIAPRRAKIHADQLISLQGGSIARRQLIAIGFSDGRVKRWLGSGRLHHTAFPGVYAGGRPDLPEQGQLAAGLLFAGHGSALGGISCLWWIGYLHRRPDTIHIDAPGRVRPHAGLSIRHPARVERLWHRDLPVVPLHAALLAATAQLEHDSLRLVIARAEFDRKLSLPSLQQALGKGVAGSVALRLAMDAHLPQLAKCANGPEREFVLLCEARGIPIPEPNERIGRFRPDMLWEEHRLIVELDGWRAHTTPAQLAADAKRQEWLESLGYTVIRFTHDQVRHRPDWVAATVRTALATS